MGEAPESAAASSCGSHSFSWRTLQTSFHSSLRSSLHLQTSAETALFKERRVSRAEAPSQSSLKRPARAEGMMGNVDPTSGQLSLLNAWLITFYISKTFIYLPTFPPAVPLESLPLFSTLFLASFTAFAAKLSKKMFLL